MGGIRRLTVSVGVDYTNGAGADGKASRVPRTQAELDTIRRLLKGGLGFDVSVATRWRWSACRLTVLSWLAVKIKARSWIIPVS